MNNLRTYTFQYNVPADNHLTGLCDHFIECKASWKKGEFYSYNGKPMVIKYGPVIEKLTNTDLAIVKDWLQLLNDVQRISQEYFADTFIIERKTCVEIAEEVLA